MAEDEVYSLVGAEIGQPILGENALAADHQAGTIGLDQSQKRFWARGDVFMNDDFSGGVQNADIHGLGMEIDAAPSFFIQLYPIFMIPVRGPGLSRPRSALNIVERALLAAAFVSGLTIHAFAIDIRGKYEEKSR